MAINDIQISDNFKLSEFQSSGDGSVKIHRKLLELLQSVRSDIDQPMIINSAYRDIEYNRKVGSNDNSQHVKGTAADISLINLELDANKLADVVENKADELEIGRGSLGLGLYDNFVHIDVRGLIGDEAPARWDNRT